MMGDIGHNVILGDAPPAYAQGGYHPRPRINRAQVCPAVVLVLHGQRWAGDLTQELIKEIGAVFLAATEAPADALWAAGGIVPVRVWPDTTLFELVSAVQRQVPSMAVSTPNQAYAAQLAYLDTNREPAVRPIGTCSFDRPAGSAEARKIQVVRDSGLQPGDVIVLQRTTAAGVLGSAPNRPDEDAVADAAMVVEDVAPGTPAVDGTVPTIATADADDAAVAAADETVPSRKPTPPPAPTETITAADFDDFEV
jgi:hypothetical protein